MNETSTETDDPDAHPREDAVTVVREALLAVNPLFVDPHDLTTWTRTPRQPCQR